MPVKKENYSTIPITLEPPIKDALEELCSEVGINRTKLMRMMVKYCMSDRVRLNDVLKHGDPPPREDS